MTEIHRTHNVATGEIVEKPLTAKEIAENKVMQDLLETGLAIAKEMLDHYLGWLECNHSNLCVDYSKLW